MRMMKTQVMSIKMENVLILNRIVWLTIWDLARRCRDEIEMDMLVGSRFEKLKLRKFSESVEHIVMSFLFIFKRNLPSSMDFVVSVFRFHIFITLCLLVADEVK